MDNTRRMRQARLYARNFIASQGETEYVRKHADLIEFIERMVVQGSGDTLEVTSQSSLGDTETEFRESLRRIKEAELFLKIGTVTYHPVDFRTIRWRKEQ